MEKGTEGEVLEEVKEPVQDAENIHQEETVEIEVMASEEPEEIKEPEAAEALAEVIVPADAEEQDLPAQVTEAVRQERARRATREEPRILRENSGVYSSEILEQEAREKDEREIENQLFQDLQRYQRTGEILWGEVVSVDPGTVYPGVIFNILWNKIIVSIPDREYFEPELDFGKTYAYVSRSKVLSGSSLRTVALRESPISVLVAQDGKRWKHFGISGSITKTDEKILRERRGRSRSETSRPQR